MRRIDMTVNWTPAERAAWQTVRPLLFDHLKKVNRVYRRGDSTVKEWIREHCRIFDRVMNIVETEQVTPES